MDSQKKQKRTFGYLQDFKNRALGSSADGTNPPIMKTLLMITVAVTLLVFIMFHPIYLKSGVPMFKYGMTMMLLPPLYFLWAVFKIVSVYVFKMNAGPI